MRKEKSIRLLTLGGSNTAFFYGTALTDFLIASTHRLYNDTKFYVLVSSTRGPTMTNFNFFVEPSNTGPNDVNLEFAINTANLWSDTMKVDQLIHYLPGGPAIPKRGAMI